MNTEGNEGNAERKYNRYIVKRFKSPNEQEKETEKEREKEKPKYEPKYENFNNRRGNKNIRIINMTHNEIDDEKLDKNKEKNNFYSSYIRAKKPIDTKQQKYGKTESEISDDLGKIDNDDIINEEFNNFKKFNFYNSFEGKMGEFDKGKTTYYYQRKKVDDSSQRKETDEDKYKRYSDNAKRFSEEKDFKKNVK